MTEKTLVTETSDAPVTETVPTDPDHTNNVKFAKTDKRFRDACRSLARSVLAKKGRTTEDQLDETEVESLAGTYATARQASKFRNKHGSVYEGRR